MRSPTRHLFLYGTLLPELRPRGVPHNLSSLTFVSEGSLHGFLYDLGRYPGVIVDPDADALVHGRVYALGDDRSLLTRIDAYEGYIEHDPQGSRFVRTPVPVHLTNGEALDCWVYAWNREVSEATLVQDGDYLTWRRARGLP